MAGGGRCPSEMVMAERAMEPSAGRESSEDGSGPCSTLGFDCRRHSRRQLLKAGVVLAASAVMGVGCGASVEDKPLEERPR